jgi:hypothetical protein
MPEASVLQVVQWALPERVQTGLVLVLVCSL